MSGKSFEGKNAPLMLGSGQKLTDFSNGFNFFPMGWNPFMMPQWNQAQLQRFPGMFDNSQIMGSQQNPGQESWSVSKLTEGENSGASKSKLQELKVRAQDSVKSRRQKVQASAKVTSEAPHISEPERMKEESKESKFESSAHLNTELENLLAEGRLAAEQSDHMKATQLSSEKNTPAPIEYDRYTVDDIDEWLTLTGFYDEPYRQKLLSRRRRMIAIEEEKQTLIREEKEENEKRQRCSAQKSFDTDNQLTSIRELLPIGGKSTKEEENAMSSKSRKRAKDDEEDTCQRPSKYMCRDEDIGQRRKDLLKSNTPYKPPLGPRRDSQPSWTPGFTDDHEGRFARRRESTRPRSRDEFRQNLRRDDLSADAPRHPGRQRDKGSRFFHMRSFNWENVEQAHRQCAWSTQSSNERTLVEAFQNSRSVMLFFSVNGSQAFQGYAKMDSLPGANGVPNPSWRAKLHWPSTAPFGLKWMTQIETPHSVAKHLINPWNDGLPVPIGKDGQEIETCVGAKLCDLLDDYARRHRGGPMNLVY